MGILGLGERRLHEPKPNGTWGNTGNLVDLLSSDVRFYSNGSGGYFSNYPGETWAQLLSHSGPGSLTVAYVLLDLDAGFAGDQHLLVNNFTLHNDVFTTPLPAALPLFATGLGVLAQEAETRCFYLIKHLIEFRRGRREAVFEF